MGNVNLIGVLISCLIAVLVLIEPFIIHKTKRENYTHVHIGTTIFRLIIMSYLGI